MFYAFCKPDGITGESKDSNHQGWIEVLSFEHAVRMKGGSVGAEGLTGGQAEVDSFQITKLMDMSSPLLHHYCVSGTPVPSVQFHVCSANNTQHAYVKYTLTNAIVASVAPNGQSKDESDRPTERVEFKFTKIKWEYSAPGGGSTPAEWDLSGNK